jgi:hypothetical protein
MAPRKNGDTGRLKDGTPVIFMDGQPRRMNEAGMADMGGGFFKSPQGQTFRAGPKGGFSQVAGPTREQVSKAAEGASGVNEALGALDMFDRKVRQVKTPGPLGWFTNGDDLNEASQLAEDLMLRLKEKPYNLGVLNGPDREILLRVVNDPTALKDAVFRKSVGPKLRNIAAKLGDTYRNDASSFKSTGGNPGALPNLFQSPDSTYTPQEWGSDGRVPPAKAPLRRGAPPRTGPGRAAAPPGQKQPFKGKYGTVYED